METGTPDATIVIVNFDSGNRLPRLLERLERESARIVVVDNASTDGSQSAAQNRAGIDLIRNPLNLGFATAANQGAAITASGWLIFANPDTHPQPGVVSKLIDHVPDDVAIVAPVQVDDKGKALSETGGHRPSLVRYAIWAVLPLRIRKDRGPWLTPPFPQVDFFPAWVSGSFMAVRREVFERVYGFDERYFLYQEDVDLCQRVTTAGYRVMCRGWVRVHHEVGQDDPARRAQANAHSVAPLAARFETPPARRALGLILTVGFALRSFSPRNGRSARAAMPAARALLKTGRPEDARI